MNFNPFDILVRVIVLITAIPVHEAAHAFAADKLGDPTAKNMGRLTLNPMMHFDLMGSICLLIGGIGWAKPVPINSNNFKDRRVGMALSAAAGPISNVLMALAALIVAKVLLYGGFRGNAVFDTLFTIFVSMARINIALAVFNLIPLPPLDGSRIFNLILPKAYYFKIMEYERYIFIIFFVLIFSGILTGPLGFLNGIMFSVIDFFSGFVDVIFQGIG